VRPVGEDGEVPIDDVLPAGAVGAEAWAPWEDVALGLVEAAAVAGAGERRRAEFGAGRHCAHRALRRLGWPEAEMAIGRRDDGAPAWPAGVVGSITHTDRYAAAAVARRTELAAIGVDAEPAEPLPAGVAELVCSPDELAWACNRAPTEAPWDRLLFSAKESAAKAWVGLYGRLPDLSEVRVAVDPAARTFSARILVAPERTVELDGRFAWTAGLILTAAGLPSA
jgi:4'-phosphopantetheinyl transferase EntD